MDANPGSISDAPYEAAIAAFGALFAGFTGLLAAFIRSKKALRVIYALFSSGKILFVILQSTITIR